MNYSKQQTKLETPAFFIFIPRLYMPSRSGEHLFVSLWHDTKERDDRGWTVRLNHISALFDPTAARTQTRRIREFQNYIWRTLIKFRMLVVENVFIRPNLEANREPTHRVFPI